MSTAMWFVFAIVALQLGTLGCLWVLYLIREHTGARHEPPPAHSGAATPPVA